MGGKDLEVFKRRIYEILEASHDGDVVSKRYDVLMLTAVIVGLIPLTMKEGNRYSLIIDVITVSIFIFDYIMRFYTSDYKMGIKSYKAYVAYVFTPMAIIDLLSIVPVLTFFFPASVTLQLFRIFRVLRILKLVRYSKTMVVIENVIRKVRAQLFAMLMIACAYIFAIAMIIFQVEPDLFEDFFDALYWATISITTIGYGDIAPATNIGRFITMLSALVGVAVVALPSGMITAAYMDEISRKKSKLEI
ncbi:voltage-gated potassium channel [Acetitomaculum ruminis DSM 5522]|uniref:Voltage-gated potassium channel n=1 Tax=Acetitomaculum ruminis DSM 5522 TaxID=1120918 RepID=A0A1I0W6G1_9FIRM|nr:ion transporter [Acetitomaculum ruminis]SFA83623.1 voltage-gated potassium channel [Acetitomaculum ruminis DSM 5522]